MFARVPVEGGAEGRLRPEDAHVLVDRRLVDAGVDGAQQRAIVGQEGVLGVRLDEHVEVGRRLRLARRRVVQDPRERVGMRNRHRIGGDDAIPRGHGDGPGHHRAPVVAHDMKTRGADGIRQADHVLHEERQRVVGDVRRAGPRRIAALIRRHHAESGPGQRRDLMAPFVGGLRKPVQQDHRLAVFRTRRPHVERVVADCDPGHHDLDAGTAGARRAPRHRLPLRAGRRSDRRRQRQQHGYREPSVRSNIHPFSIPRRDRRLRSAEAFAATGDTPESRAGRDRADNLAPARRAPESDSAVAFEQRGQVGYRRHHAIRREPQLVGRLGGAALNPEGGQAGRGGAGDVPGVG